MTATFRTALSVLALTGTLVTVPSIAATPPDTGLDGHAASESLLFQSSDYIRDLVERAQRALTTLGLYEGPISGEVGPLLIDAIERFQRRDRQLGSAIIDEDLVERLEASVNIGALLDRLSKARERDKAAAREQLLANPETRALIEQNQANEPAMADRDSASCFGDPDPACLLFEATESARAVTTPGRRDWALGEVIVAQILTGLSDDAMVTAASMSDPRLIIVGLRRIAEAEATAGRSQAAASALEMIPDADEQLTARIDVARVFSHLGEHDAALKTTEGLRGDDADTAMLALNGGAELALFLHAADRTGEAETWLARLTLSVRDLAASGDRDAGYKAMANAYLAIGRPDVGLALLERIDGVSQRNAVLIEAAHRMAELGRTVEAFDLAETVRGDRYKALAFADIAEALISVDASVARKSLARARKIADDIRLPFARDFAVSRIALTQALMQQVDHDRVRDLAAGIKDQELRAETLWLLRLQHGDFYSDASEEAVSDIQGDFNAAWLLASLADRFVNEDADAARDLLERALGTAEQVKTPWARARLLAKLATVLHRVPD